MHRSKKLKLQMINKYKGNNTYAYYYQTAGKQKEILKGKKTQG